MYKRNDKLKRNYLCSNKSKINNNCKNYTKEEIDEIVKNTYFIETAPNYFIIKKKGNK